MENRFGFKDLILCLLLVAVIIMIALAMEQFDRQYQLVVRIQEQSNDQLRELIEISDTLKHGVAFSATTQPSAGAGKAGDPFESLEKLRADGKYDQGDWFILDCPAQVAKITPLLGTDEYSYVIYGRVMEWLAYQDPQTLEYKPLLAESWTITDNTKAWQEYVDKRKLVPITGADITAEADCPPPDKPDDRKQYIERRMKEGRRENEIGAEADCPPAEILDFKLRHGVTFSDGSPFSADDVLFTYNWIENPKVDAPRDREEIDRVKSCEKVNDYEVVFKMREPYYGSMNAVASGIWIMSKNFYSKYTPEEFNNSVGLLIGTGPYRMANPTEWKPAPGKIELVRNEHYWGVPPSFDKIILYQVEQDSTSLVLYGNGEIDYLGMQAQPYSLALKNKALMDRSNHLEYSSPLSGYYFIGWNQLRNGKPTMFADTRVRQAMTQLIDREGICKTIYLGYADPAPGPFSPQTLMHDPALVDWKFDPNAAKALLKDAGYEDRGKGVLEKSDGTQLSFKVTYPAKNETVDRLMQFVHDNLARAGVNAELDPVDWTIIDQREKGRDFDAIVMGWGGGSMEDDIHQMFDSSQIADQGDDFVSYSNPEFDRVSRLARRTLDDDKRQELWHQCEHILHDDQPYTFLTVNKLLRLADKRVQNIEKTRAGLNVIWDWTMPVPWYVPAAMQKYRQ